MKNIAKHWVTNREKSVFEPRCFTLRTAFFFADEQCSLFRMQLPLYGKTAAIRLVCYELVCPLVEVVEVGKTTFASVSVVAIEGRTITYEEVESESHAKLVVDVNPLLAVK